ncbi:MAG: hypothetical protein ACREDU_11350, partial [Methylocella sp.]
IIVRGELRMRIPLKEITIVEARDGELRVAWKGGAAAFDLGSEAAKWAERIRNPKTLMEKLGVKAGQRIGIVGIRDEGFEKGLGNIKIQIASTKFQNRCDLVFLPRTGGKN